MIKQLFQLYDGIRLIKDSIDDNTVLRTINNPPKYVINSISNIMNNNSIDNSVDINQLISIGEDNSNDLYFLSVISSDDYRWIMSDTDKFVYSNGIGYLTTVTDKLFNGELTKHEMVSTLYKIVYALLYYDKELIFDIGVEILSLSTEQFTIPSYDLTMAGLLIYTVNKLVKYLTGSITDSATGDLDDTLRDYLYENFNINDQCIQRIESITKYERHPRDMVDDILAYMN